MSTQRLSRISIFVVLTIIGGMIKFPVPFTGIMFTMQTLFVILAGLVLGARDGAISQIVYVVIGLVGVPIFTKGGGIWYVFEPSFGFLISFSMAAFSTGFLKSRLKKMSVFGLFLCCLSGLAFIYIIGIFYMIMILWLYIGMGFVAAMATVPPILVMLVADIVTVYLVCLVYPRINTLIGPIKYQNTKIGDNNNQNPIAEGTAKDNN